MNQRMNLKRAILAIFLIVIIFPVYAQVVKDEQDMAKGWEKGVKSDSALDTVLQEWNEMGFGVFIHWTPAVAFQSRYNNDEVTKDLWGEWFLKRSMMPENEYSEYIKGWNPSDFNADAWADLFVEAGFKYMIFVSKHHDGFTLFDSKANDYSITKHTSFGRDPFKELCNAMQDRGLKTGFYYSHGTDWNNKIGLTGTPEEIDRKYFQETLKPHLQDLSSEYGEQFVAWFDLGWKNREDLSRACIDILRSNNPNILISSRIGSGLGNFRSEGDVHIPSVTPEGYWETNMTFDGHWNWVPSDKMNKSAPELIQMIAKVRARGGNMLLNIGPDVRGRIPVRERIALKKIGKWLEENGESIYGVQKTPYQDLPWGVCTHKPGKLFLHIMNLPSSDFIFLPGLKSNISKVSFLADSGKSPLNFAKVDGGWNIELKTENISADVFNEASTVLVVEYEGELNVDPTPVLDQDLDNWFIAPLAEKENGAQLKLKRMTAIVENPGVEEPVWHEFINGFSNKGAKASWNFNLTEENRFCFNIEYANLTGRTLNAIIKAGGISHKLELPPTNRETNPWEMFTLITTGSEVLEPGTGHLISFELDEDNLLDDLDEMYKTPIKRERGCTKFMLKSVVLKPFYPLPYEGYSYGVK